MYDITNFLSDTACPYNHSFFFHAEDGIRYTSVTGVQTCALPISLLQDLDDALTRRNLDVARFAPRPSRRDGGWVGRRCHEGIRIARLAVCLRLAPTASFRSDLRSEERRVGKGGRAEMYGSSCSET